MQYKSRENKDLQGLPKVYFTGHPDDCRLYFESISEDILKLYNCVIFYDPDPETPEDRDNFELDLKSMNLVVIVISKKYVYQHTFAHDTAFRLAQDNHIPVLPILEEDFIGMDDKEKKAFMEAFNKKIDDLQFLNPNSGDVTEISYKEKLKKFLDSVLTGDGLAEKIRAAFDAYVFLSYRKKDRQYAQKLMSLIHKNEFCRDIAIWYDEFLVPGENFNSAIQKAMEKSELFALAVTPNLLENGNYVMQQEYPAAKSLDKNILPVELAPTDNEELKKSYENIPEPISSDDETALSEALTEAFKNVYKPKNDSDPQHVFFIGLAYLNGIDVEKNNERAVEMITFSAEHGLREAVEKLADIYRHGIGTHKDFEQAARWYERLAEIDRAAYEESRDEAQATVWIDDMLALAACRKMMGQNYKECYERIFEHCDNTELSDCWEDKYLEVCEKDAKTRANAAHGIARLPKNDKYFERIMRVIKKRGLPLTLEELENSGVQTVYDEKFCAPILNLCAWYSLFDIGRKNQKKHEISADELIRVYKKITGSKWKVTDLKYIQNEDETWQKLEEIWFNPSSPTEQFEAMDYAYRISKNKIHSFRMSELHDLSNKNVQEIGKVIDCFDRYYKNVMSFTEQDSFPQSMEVILSTYGYRQTMFLFSGLLSYMISWFEGQENIILQKEYAEKYFEYASTLTQRYPFIFLELLSESFELCGNKESIPDAERYAEKVIELITNISDEKIFKSSLELIFSKHPSPVTAVNEMRTTLNNLASRLNIIEWSRWKVERYSEIVDLIDNFCARKRNSFEAKEFLNRNLGSVNALKEMISNRWVILGFVADDNVVESFDEDHIPNYALGCMYERRSNPKAIECYTRELETLEEYEPKAEFCYYGLTEAYQKLKDHRSALKYAKKLISSMEARAEATHSVYAIQALIDMYFKIAGLYHDLHEYSTALGYYERADKYNGLYNQHWMLPYPYDFKTFVEMVNTYIKTEKYMTAKKICDDRYSQETANDNIIWVYESLFRFELPSFYHQLAEIFVEKEQPEDAKDCYEKCIEMAEGNVPSKKDWNALAAAYIFMAGLPDTPPEKSAELLCNARDLFRDQLEKRADENNALKSYDRDENNILDCIGNCLEKIENEMRLRGIE